MQITIQQNILEANERKAGELRNLLKKKKIFMVNLIGSPGAGKTTLLERTLPALMENYNYKVAVIEGDVATARDAERLRKFGAPVIMVNTGGACHLESVSIEKAFAELDLDELDLVFVENVGNLVCPAEFDIGEDVKVALVSVPEGDDKPIKYPLLFREAALLILNKIDLLEHVNFARESFYKDVKNLNAGLQIMEISCKKQPGLTSWLEWIKDGITNKQNN